ncbi:unnamed protein product [Lampetra planeri]
MSEVLKRKFEEVEGCSGLSSPKDWDDDLSSSDSGDSGDSVNAPADGLFPPAGPSASKRARGKNVRFDQVTVYYFLRRQGFTSVPSQGGSTLGMASCHDRVAVYSLGEFAQERERAHQHMLRQHLKEERLNALRLQLMQSGAAEPEHTHGLTVDDIPDEEVDARALDVDDYFFLQPLPTRKRRAMLRASGVRRIDGDEKQQLRAIRVSREECGCDCRSHCDPETCGCSQAGISCQVDRLSFPCGCTLDGCGNASGRVEFNPVRVRTHFIHTIMRLELEKKEAGQHSPKRPTERPSPTQPPPTATSPAHEPAEEPAARRCRHGREVERSRQENVRGGEVPVSTKRGLHGLSKDSLSHGPAGGRHKGLP